MGAGASCLRIKMLRRGRPGGWMVHYVKQSRNMDCIQVKRLKANSCFQRVKKKTRFCLISLILQVIGIPNLIVPDKTLLLRIMTIKTMH